MCSGRVPDLSGSNRKSSATDGGKSNRRHNQPTRSSRTQCPSTWNISSRGEHIFLSSVTNFPHAPIKLVLKTPANSNLAKPVFIARYSMSSIINKITQKIQNRKSFPTIWITLRHSNSMAWVISSLRQTLQMRIKLKTLYDPQK